MEKQEVQAFQKFPKRMLTGKILEAHAGSEYLAVLPI